MAIYKKQFRTGQPVTSAIRKDGFLPFETKGFTFGFEIEGVFHKDLEDSLPSGGTFKRDGTVNVAPCHFNRDDWVVMTGRESDYATEYNSPVFKSIEELIACLRLFTKAVYYSNETCGIHLHIGNKSKNLLHNKFYTEVIMKQLESRFLPLICPCVNERIQGGGQWCKLHETGEFREGRIYNTSKYRAVNLHHTGTIELRLFAPCQHLIANIQKVLTEFFRVGYRDYNFETSPIVCVVSKSNKVEIVEVVTPDRQSYTYGFDKNREFAISPLAQIADFINYENADREVNGDYQARRNYDLYRLGQEIPRRNALQAE